MADFIMQGSWFACWSPRKHSDGRILLVYAPCTIPRLSLLIQGAAWLFTIGPS